MCTTAIAILFRILHIYFVMVRSMKLCIYDLHTYKNYSIYGTQKYLL